MDKGDYLHSYKTLNISLRENWAICTVESCA